jgi:predicted nuclease of predicted toxin-antitoxin system
MLRLLVDMNLSIEWIPLLAQAGHQAVHWSEVGDPRAPDAELMRWARRHHHAVFTHDLDFGTALALTGEAGPSVIQVRCRNVLPERIGNLVLVALMSYQDDLLRGALLVIEEERERVRILPLSSPA